MVDIILEEITTETDRAEGNVRYRVVANGNELVWKAGEEE